jgi:serine protease Do
MKRIASLFFSIIVLLMMTGCAAIWLPKKQTVTIKANDSKSSVYLNNKEIGTGTSFTTKIKRDGIQQVVTQTPGYKDEYNVMIPKRNTIMYVPLRLLSFACFFLPGYYETILVAYMPKKYAYNKVMDFSSSTKLATRGDKKYVSLEAIKLDIKNVKKDIDVISLRHKQDLSVALGEAESDYRNNKTKQAVKEEKKNKKKGKELNSGSDEMRYEDTKFSLNVEKTLKETNFVDTVNQIFQDDLNTLFLQGVIKNLTMYQVSKYRYNYQTAKLKIVWRIKNNYGEILDSITREDMAGNFAIASSYYQSEKEKHDKAVESMLGDAVDISFQRLLTDSKFQKYLNTETYKNPYSTTLTLPSPKAVVSEVGEAMEASVIIKRKDKGHGSGFAISNDGYILTNYHVIAGDIVDKYADFTVVLSDGSEKSAQIVRVNKSNDVALLKVDAKFDKAFKLIPAKGYKKLQEVYCVGTPKSMELGQTVSMGILSNERNVNNNSVLQLSMSINPGNSGGPLFGKNGTLFGVIQSKLVGYATEGIGFAIPSYKIGEYLNIEYK